MEGDIVDPTKLGLPKRLYYVKIVGTLSDDALPLRYREKGGGKYTNKANAIAQRDNLRYYNKLDARLFETQPLEWTEVES
jgi:hypothetical protein